MKRAGRASALTIVALVAVVAVMGVLVWSFLGVSPRTVASEFMTALATGDGDKLTELTYMENTTPEEIRKKWDFSLSAGKHYLFIWKIVGDNQPDDESASIRLDITRNYASPVAYAEKYDLLLVKRPEGWKVDVRSIKPTMYPALPR